MLILQNYLLSICYCIAQWDKSGGKRTKSVNDPLPVPPPPHPSAGIGWHNATLPPTLRSSLTAQHLAFISRHTSK